MPSGSFVRRGPQEQLLHLATAPAPGRGEAVGRRTGPEPVQQHTADDAQDQTGDGRVGDQGPGIGTVDIGERAPAATACGVPNEARSAAAATATTT